MPRYRHPARHPPKRVHVTRADKRAVDEDGVFDAPRSVAEAIAGQYDTTIDEMAVDGVVNDSSAGEGDASDETEDAETCSVVKGDGEVCGRTLPCPYHDAEDE